MTKETLNSLLYVKDSILTNSGKYLNIADPQPDQICIEDIAHALSRIPRFVGQLNANLNVAEHCLFVTGLVPQEYKLEALLHDATEAYLSDLPSPVKNLCPGYKALERKLYGVIAGKYGIPWLMSQTVMNADRSALEVEFELYALNKREFNLNPDISKKHFIELFNLLTAWHQEKN